MSYSNKWDKKERERSAGTSNGNRSSNRAYLFLGGVCVILLWVLLVL